MDPNLTSTTLDFLTSTFAPYPDNETTIRPADINPPIRKCNYFVIGHNNQTVVFDFSNQYGGKLLFFFFLTLSFDGEKKQSR